MAKIHYGVKTSRKHGGPKMAKIQYGVKPDIFKKAGFGAARASHDSPPNVHISGFRPWKTPPKIPREDPQRARKRAKMGAGEGKKREILGGPAEGGLAESKPTTTRNNNNNNNDDDDDDDDDNNNIDTIWGGSVLTGEEPPPHSGELKHALPQAGGPTQSQLSRPMSSGHHISMEHRLLRKQLNSDTNASKKIERNTKKQRREQHFSSEKMKNIKKSKNEEMNKK